MLKGVGDVTESAPNKKPLPYFVKLLLFCIFGFLFVFGILKLFPTSATVDKSCSSQNISTNLQNVRIYEKSKKVFRVETATTPSRQELGLSGRPCFPKDGALIFMYAADDKFGIWMKDMKFAIDVVWLDKDKKIVSIEKDMQPSSFPKVYYPSSDARYVVEFNKGIVDEIGATVGTTFKW